MIDVHAHNQEVQDRWDRIATDMQEELPAEKFFSYLDMDEVMALFTTALEDRSERCLKQALIDMALYVNDKLEDEIAAEKDAYIDALDAAPSIRQGHLAWHAEKAKRAA
jgi:hypothetical protein